MISKFFFVCLPCSDILHKVAGHLNRSLSLEESLVAEDIYLETTTAGNPVILSVGTLVSKTQCGKCSRFNVVTRKLRQSSSSPLLGSHSRRQRRNAEEEPSPTMSGGVVLRTRSHKRPVKRCNSLSAIELNNLNQGSSHVRHVSIGSFETMTPIVGSPPPTNPIETDSAFTANDISEKEEAEKRSWLQRKTSDVSVIMADMKADAEVVVINETAASTSQSPDTVNGSDIMDEAMRRQRLRSK